MSAAWRWLLTGILGAALGVWLVTLWLPGWLADPRPAPAHSAVVKGDATPPDARRIHATLFYVAPDGDGLVGVDQDVPYAAAPAVQARHILEAQLGPAPFGQVPAVPAGADVRAVFITDAGDAFVDISAALATAHPGGSQHESLTIHAIVHALTTNLPTIRAVQILIEGREVETLAGHVDLRHPLARDPRWIVP